jgi:hypothetical protein
MKTHPLFMPLVPVFLVSCSGVTPSGPLSGLGDQSAAEIVARTYYPTGVLKSELTVKGYTTTNPNPQLTEATRSTVTTKILTEGAKSTLDSTLDH